MLTGLLFCLLHRCRKQRQIRNGFREAHPVLHRDLFEVDPHDGRSVALAREPSDGHVQGHIIPFQPYVDDISSRILFPSIALTVNVVFLLMLIIAMVSLVQRQP